MSLPLPLRPLGQTGIQVSPIGLGTVKFGRNQSVKYPDHFELPTDQQIVDLLVTAQTLGINTIDTAPAYGSSEQRLGQLLPGKRSDWVIIGKVGETFVEGISHYQFDADFIEQSILQSLKNLNTDYLDVMLIHSNGDDVHIIQHDNVFETLEKLKAQKLIRALGMSTKTIAGGLLTIEQADVAMITYNLNAPEEKPIIEAAYQQNKGILIKKALGSGHLTKISEPDPLQASMDFIFSTQGIGSVIVGTINPKHLQENVNAAARALAHNIF
ncbi:MAG TPA: aldo/keto reductase [Gammaproteobacteria bacterium]|nr:aldo/keto reductase [Gammaproteobacteria bacterium]